MVESHMFTDKMKTTGFNIFAVPAMAGSSRDL